MSVKQFTASERIGPAKLPMSLDVGRLTARDAAQLFGLSIAALAVAAIGGLLAWLAWPDYVGWSGWRVVFVSFGLAVGGLGVGLAVVVGRLSVRDWTSYQQRLDDIHQLYLESHEQAGGVEIERTLTGWELTLDKPLHVLALALSVHERVMQGDQTAFSERKIGADGSIWLGGVKLGQISQGAAAEGSRLLADVGLIQGRGPRQAGRWAAQSTDDVIRAVTRDWARRGATQELVTIEGE